MVDKTPSLSYFSCLLANLWTQLRVSNSIIIIFLTIMFLNFAGCTHQFDRKRLNLKLNKGNYKKFSST